MRQFRETQQGRSLHHPRVPQDDVTKRGNFSFVVCADTQLGMTSSNAEWETELAYARQAVRQINRLEPRPAFCCCCGDLIDMEYTFYVPKGWDREDCDKVQDEQNRNFQSVWNELHPDIAMVCLCGNHDVGNKPSPESIQRFTDAFGDDYLGFWVNGTYNICLNTALFSNPSAAMQLYQEQLDWLEERLKYAKANEAANIFVFGHHPWFLYSDDEEELPGIIPYQQANITMEGGFPDSYFHIPLKYRTGVLELFREYQVDACFSGHFHQNLVSKSSFGMDMIITSSLSMVFDSNGKPPGQDPSVRGIRVVNVCTGDKGERGTYSHHFKPLEEEEEEN